MESIFKLMPDTSPCDMAIICRKPCFEVVFPPSRVFFHRHLIIIIILNQIYIYRKHETIYSDEKILENRPAPRKKSAKKKLSSKFFKSCIVIYIF